MSVYVPQRGDGALITTDGIAAKLIQFFTRSEVNHTATLVNAETGETREAKPRKGVCVGNINDYKKFVWMKHINPTPAQRETICAFVISQTGRGYGFIADAVYFAKVVGLRFFSNSQLVNRLAISEGWMCSELHSGALAAADYKLPNPINLMAPVDLLMFDVTY
jgi:hypothetical protein